jgi:hypothetical protein
MDQQQQPTIEELERHRISRVFLVVARLAGREDDGMLTEQVHRLIDLTEKEDVA